MTTRTVKVRNLDTTARRVLPKDRAKRLTRLRWLEAIEGWDEINLGNGWESLADVIANWHLAQPSQSTKP